MRVGIIEPVSDDTDEMRALATLGRLTRGALHELSNPLVALLGSAELALGDAEPGTKLHDRIALTRRTGAEVVEIVRALQAFVRLQPQPPEELSVGDAAADAVALVTRVLPTHDVELQRERRRDGRRGPGRDPAAARRAAPGRARRSRARRRDRARRRRRRRHRRHARELRLLAAEALALRVVERLGRDLAAHPLAEDLDLDRRPRRRARGRQVRVRDRAPDRVAEAAARDAADELAGDADRLRAERDGARRRRASGTRGAAPARPRASSASLPRKSLSRLTANPSPASYGVSSAVMSEPQTR